MTNNEQGSFGFKYEDKGTWTRTCQECGTKVTRFKEPKGEMTDKYAYAKCPKCKSEALDYGSYVFTNKKDD